MSSSSIVKNLLSLNTLLVFVVIAVILRVMGADDVLIFGASALAIVPLAGLIGSSTEEIAARTGPQVGGLLNATLGNAAELIITIFALREGLLELVRASLIGSVLGNLLLVMGASILAGGLKNGLQKFDRRVATMNATLLIMAFMALAIPSLFDATFVEQDAFRSELLLSEGIAVILIALYVANIIYSFFAGGGPAESTTVHHEPKWSTRTAIGVLVFATLAIVAMSEFLVGTVEPVVEKLGWSELFVGVIIVPIIGNVAEHLVAVQQAIKNHMELSVSIALGSSLQIALFVAPVLVFISLLFEDKLILAFTLPEVIALAAASYIAAMVAEDGESNWLEGVMLLAVYLIIGLAFFLLPEATLATH
ncbi:MAG TPA: calcium/proton exchanger [Aggregatilinea sp.]|jgi:Ca2+:H+ antiporter|uniref:calcium/proton exchanger n=1 Tax=Aggregatilinea sp. TaxID=2806333 RepID=UPI002B611617|nr:calcium/proton exchanger [Aggregatilinea sp.]HML24902.1 calcium/proton exchanger [Aggregatilinea sp.]